MSAMTKTVRIRIKGVVQGVGFRYWIVREAEFKGLKGWVRNRVDGTVEALISGPLAQVDAMVEACRAGPRGARVTEVSVGAAVDAVPKGFTQRPSL